MKSWQDKERKRFWAEANGLGLDGANVHELFGVDSMNDYAGTPAEAMATLDQYRNTHEQQWLQEACRELPEAAISANVRFVTPKGYDIQFTMRGGLPPHLSRLAMRNLTEQIKLFEEGAGKLGWEPRNGYKSNVQPVAIPVTPQHAAPPVAGMPAPVPPPQPQTSGNGGGGVIDTEFVKVTQPRDKPQVEFWRNGRQYYEIRWNFGGERLLELAPWLSERGYTAAHFDAVGTQLDLPLRISWAQSTKDPKWKDVTAIAPAA